MTRKSDPDGWYDPDGTAGLRARIAELEAEVARLTERVAYFEREYQDSVSRTEAIENVETAKAEIARLTALEAERDKLQADADYWVHRATRNLP